MKKFVLALTVFAIFSFVWMNIGTASQQAELMPPGTGTTFSAQ